MSLIKQLWIGIVIVAGLAFGGSLIISTLSARHYLEQQLYVKNVDNAASLALSLSQMPKDPVTVELQVAAQFDAGHYRLIRLDSPTGEVIVERVNEAAQSGAPEWFIRLVPITTGPGVAQVQDGWRQFGTLTLESHSGYAYAALWNGTLMLLAWFLAGAALTGLLGTLLLKHITRPLGRVVRQAEAIGGRRFVTTEEPSTTEFRSVVRAMNALSERVRTMLAEESQRLEQLRRQNQHDELTGLFTRKQFLNLLDAALTRDDAPAGGVLALARVEDLTALNQQLGRPDTDRLLCAIAERFQALAETESGWEAGRLNASDFALLAPGGSDAGEIARAVSASLDEVANVWQNATRLQLPIGAGSYRAGQARADLLASVDGALAAAEQSGERAVRLAPEASDAPQYADLADWRSALTQALETSGVRLELFPVMSADGTLLHYEAPMRLLLDGTWCSAGHFMPRAIRLGLISRFDIAVVRAALARISENNQPLGINISSESIVDAGFRNELFALLQSAPGASALLWIELPEYDVVRHLAEFRALCLALKPLHCRLGIEHVGGQFSRIGELHELGLDYIKIDSSVIRDIDIDSGNQSFVRGLCALAHAIGVSVIAEGVTSEPEATTLILIGVDGITGPGVRPPNGMSLWDARDHPISMD